MTKFLIFLFSAACVYFRQTVGIQYVSLLLLFVFLWCSVKNDFILIIKYSSWFVSASFFLAGVVCCDTFNLWLAELQTESTFCGAVPVAAIYVEMSLILISRMDMFFQRRKVDNVQHGFWVELLLLSVWLIGLICWFSVLKRPSFLLGLDRFAYETLLNPIVAKCRNVLQCVAPVAITFYLLNGNGVDRHKIFVAIFAIAPFLLFLMWIGNKSGVFIFIFLSIIAPCYVLIDKSIVKFQHVIVLSFVFICFLVCVLVKQFSSYGVDSVGESIFGRIAQQGQLWWMTTKECDGMHWNEFRHDAVSALTSHSKDNIDFESYGVYKLMDLYAPSKSCEAKRNAGSRYSAYGIELPYYHVGMLGILVSAIVNSFLLVFVVNSYLISISQFNFVSTILAAKLQIIIAGACSQGDWYELFSLKTLFLLLVMVLLIAYYEKNRKYKMVS